MNNEIFVNKTKSIQSTRRRDKMETHEKKTQKSNPTNNHYRYE